MYKNRLQNMSGDKHNLITIGKQAAVFNKLRKMLVAVTHVRLQIGCGAKY